MISGPVFRPLRTVCSSPVFLGASPLYGPATLGLPPPRSRPTVLPLVPGLGRRVFFPIVVPAGPWEAASLDLPLPWVPASVSLGSSWFSSHSPLAHLVPLRCQCHSCGSLWCLGFLVRVGCVPPAEGSLFRLGGSVRGAGGSSSDCSGALCPLFLGMLWCGRLPFPLPPSRRSHLVGPP